MNIPVAFPVAEGPETAAPQPSAASHTNSAAAGARPIACIRSDQLLAGATEVHIEHRGAIYRLKQTSLGKLILTK
jgi:hemin uptake protein HemP